MSNNLPAIVAGSTTRSSKTRHLRLVQPSEVDAAERCSIQTEPEFLEASVFCLMAILQGITENTCSGDVIALGVFRAKDLCKAYGIPLEVFNKVIDRYLSFSDNARSGNPLAF